MKLQVDLLDLRLMLKEKCDEIIADKKISEALFRKLCDIEDDERFETDDDKGNWKEPVRVMECNHSRSIEVEHFDGVCTNCSTYLKKNWKACPICGRRVQWQGGEDR